MELRTAAWEKLKESWKQETENTFLPLQERKLA